MAKAEFIKKYGIEKWEKRLEQMRIINRRYRAKNADKLKERYSDPDFREKKRLNTKEWHETHKENPEYRADMLVRGYKQYDKKKGRGETRITAQWILDNIYTKPCFYCGETDWKLLGCDRIDNNKPHTPENCVCSCNKCNRKRGRQDFKSFCEKMGVYDKK